MWMLQLETAGKLRASRGWCADEERPAGTAHATSAAPASEEVARMHDGWEYVVAAYGVDGRRRSARGSG